MTFKPFAVLSVLSVLVGNAIAQVSEREVEFIFSTQKDLKSVSIAGDFNNWNKDATPMTLSSGSWRARVKVKFGKHRYKLVLDGRDWVTDPGAKAQEEDGNGNTNSVVFVAPVGFEEVALKGDGKVTVEAIGHTQEMPSVNWEKGNLTLSILARTGDIESAEVTILDSESKSVPMVEGAKGEFFTRWKAIVPWDRKSEISYVFQIRDGNFGAGLDAYGVLLPYQKRATKSFTLDPKSFEPMVVPSWVEKSVIYQIFPDRFENGNKANDPVETLPWSGEPTWFNWFGGDLAGVQQHVGYLKDLGVNCIYFNPIFEGPSNHRYESTDYKKIDHRLGTNKVFRDLTATLQKSGIRTVLDGVFNHTGVDFFAFRDVVKKQQQSEYLNWYTVKSFPVAAVDPAPYEAWAGFKSMPKLNTTNSGVQNYLLSVPEFWAKEAKISGWRLDVANEVSPEYWRLFRKKVKSLDPNNWIVGEIWTDASPWLKGDQFDSVMNYQFRTSVLEFVAQKKTTPSQFWNSLMTVYESYGAQVNRNLMNLLSSHDTPRILSECKEDRQLAKLCAMIQFTWVGTPSVYYGDEIGMSGGADPQNRRGMVWGQANDSNDFLPLYKDLIRLRQSTGSLQSGEPEFVSADDNAGLVTFRRKFAGQWSLVAINRGNKPQKFSVKCNESVRCRIFDNGREKVRLIETLANPKTGQVFDVLPLSVTVISTDGPRQLFNK